MTNICYYGLMKQLRYSQLRTKTKVTLHKTLIKPECYISIDKDTAFPSNTTIHLL